MQTFVLIGLLSLSACANFDSKHMQDEAIKDCYNNGGQWDYEYNICKGAIRNTPPARSEDDVKKNYPWAKWKKK